MRFTLQETAEAFTRLGDNDMGGYVVNDGEEVTIEFNSLQIANWLKELDYTREALYKACNGNEYIADIFLKQARKEKLNDGR